MPGKFAHTTTNFEAPLAEAASVLPPVAGPRLLTSEADGPALVSAREARYALSLTSAAARVRGVITSELREPSSPDAKRRLRGEPQGGRQRC